MGPGKKAMRVSNGRGKIAGHSDDYYNEMGANLWCKLVRIAGKIL